MKVLKFGGTSVATPERVQHIAALLKAKKAAGEEFVVVVSAFGGITNLLEKMCEHAEGQDHQYLNYLEEHKKRHIDAVEALLRPEDHQRVKEELRISQVELEQILQGTFLINELSCRTKDNILSHGERCSAFIISEAFKAQGLEAHYVDTRKIVKTDSEYGQARVHLSETYENIRSAVNGASSLPIITGFIGSNEKGITTTLGRGGSDYTAALFAAALEAEEIEIWTDVNGVLTADPRHVKQAFPVNYLSYQEAMEMSHFGARVIYPPTIIPALGKKIPIRIKNTFEPEFPGTLIGATHEPIDSPHLVKGMASINDIALVTVQGSALFGGSKVLARIFGVTAENDLNVILITQGSSEHSLCFAIPPNKAQIAQEALETEFALEIQAKVMDPIKVERNLSVIAIIGEQMKSRPGISSRLFQALGRNGINVVLTAQGSSERNISVVISQEDENKALNAIHEAYFLSNTFSINLFIVGVGLIGGTLLRQVQDHAKYLKEVRSMEVNVVALANTKRMVFKKAGLDLDRWKEMLDDSSEIMDMDKFVNDMIEMNLPNSIFVDNTADGEIISQYPRILDESISISTPNKVATSSQLNFYRKLKEVADRRGVQFAYETNVGAGLPVITTIADLVNSGDQIIRIEGILSGSLSYIFNNFGEGVSFSEVVGKAQELGYTEPDPRIDLSGKDVARKLLILARESGIPMEPEDIEVENILPQSCLDAPDVPSFMEALKAADDGFESLRADAAKQGKVLRYIATLEGDKAFISLQRLDASNPFYSLSGSDNMIVFTTDRYRERPLVIKGPGAGAEVTAAGVFAEIIRIANQLSPILRIPE